MIQTEEKENNGSIGFDFSTGSKTPDAVSFFATSDQRVPAHVKKVTGMDQGKHSEVIVHTIFIVLYLASMVIGSVDVVSLVLRVVTGFFISFYLVGESLKSTLSRYFTFSKGTLGGEIAFSVFLSLAYFMCASIFLSLCYSLTNINLALALVGAITISDFVGLRVPVSKDFETSTIAHMLNPRNLWPVVIIISLGLSLGLLFRADFAWPSMPGWDQYTYLGGSNWILIHQGTTNLLPKSPSLFLPTSYLFQLLIASTATFSGLTPYLIFWIGPFFTIPVYGLLVYSVSIFFARKVEPSLFAALIAMTISGGESLLGPQYFFPSTLSVLLFLLLLNVVLEFNKRGSLQAILIYLFIILFYSVYYFPFVVTFPILLFFLLRNRLPRSWLDKHLFALSMLIFVAMIIVSWASALFLSSDTLPVTEKFQVINSVYPGLLLFLFFGGGLISVWHYWSKKSGAGDFILLFGYTFSLLVVCVLPPTSSTRTEIFLRGFLAILASSFLAWVQEALKPLRNTLTSFRWQRYFSEKIPSYVLLILLLFLLMQPFLSYAQNVSNWSNISSDEYLSAEWIGQNSKPNSYILTDPSTGYLVRGLTIRNSSTSLIIDGHTPSPNDWPDLTDAVYDFFREDDVSKVADYDQFPKRPDFIMITTRTVAWASQEDKTKTFPAPIGAELTPFPGIDKFSSPFFVLVRSWQTVRIYRLADAKIVPVWTDDSFSDGWKDWYLDGEYKNYSSAAFDSILNVTVQAKNNEDSWMGLTCELPDVSSIDFAKLRYKIDFPCYELEFVTWRSDHEWTIHTLEQSQQWREQAFTLTEQEASSLTKIGIVMWTKDTIIHTVELDYVFLGKIAS